MGQHKKNTRLGPEKPTYAEFERVGILPLRVGLELIRNVSAIVEINGYKVNIKSSGQRLPSFERNTTCVTCKLEGLYFAIERRVEHAKMNSRYHMNLWGTAKNGLPVLFTHDHIVPLSKGGRNSLKKTVTMCGPCNWAKGAEMPKAASA